MKFIQRKFHHRLQPLAAGVLIYILLGLVPVSHAAQTDPGGGIGGTGITGFGVVQKFGSIFVNGREFFFDETAQVSREGVPIGQEALQLGDVVVVQGNLGKKAGTGNITHVDVHIAVQGRIQDIDAARGTFRVLDQTVHVGSGTYATSGSKEFSLGQVRVGEMVAVSGFRRADGVWMASRVVLLRTPIVNEFIVRAAVTAVDRAKGTVTLGKQSFLVTDSRFDASLRSGTLVRIAGSYEGERTVATTIQRESPLTKSTGRLVEMSGYIQAIPGAREARTNDVTLRYDLKTTMVNGRIADLRSNTPVAVRGELALDGSIAVREMVINIDPRDVALPELEMAPRPMDAEIGERQERAETEKPETERPEVERPEMEIPEMEIPEREHPELPAIER